jgi:hypothetical protein
MTERIGLLCSAIVLLVLVTGCGPKRQLSISGPRLPRVHATGDMSGEDTLDRVKDRIHSLRSESKVRRPDALQWVADLSPLPLISPSKVERVVGTTGVWTIVATTKQIPPGSPSSQEPPRNADSRETRHTTWILLAGCAATVAAIVVTAREHSRRRRIR